MVNDLLGGGFNLFEMKPPPSLVEWEAIFQPQMPGSATKIRREWKTVIPVRYPKNRHRVYKATSRKIH